MKPAYITPPAIVQDPELLGGMPLALFYREVAPGGALDRAGFPAPAPWTAGRRKRKWSRDAVLAWKQAADQAALARIAVDAALDDASSNVVALRPPTTTAAAGTARTGWEAWALDRARRAGDLGD